MPLPTAPSKPQQQQRQQKELPQQQQQQQKKEAEKDKKPKKRKKSPPNITVVEYEISCDEMGIAVPPPPYLPRRSFGAVMNGMNACPNYIDQEYLVSNLNPEPWELVKELTLVDRANICARGLGMAAARLQRTGEEDGVYVEFVPDEWVEVGESTKSKVADPDEDEYVVL